MSSKKQYDVIVYVGRFQPCHNAHIETIKLALERADTVVVVIGSANEPRTYFKNPFTVDERKQMLSSAILEADPLVGDDQIVMTQVENHPSDAQWALNVRKAVGKIDGLKVGKIGFKKDEKVVHDLNLFPEWEYVETPQFEPVDATMIRKVFFEPTMPLTFLAGVTAKSTRAWLANFQHTQEYANLLGEKLHIEEYRRQFEGLRYPPIFVTADAVVIQSGHVLMIKRKAEPGKGLWALPGGFVNAKTDASVEDAAIRELFEETGIQLTRKKETTEKILRKNIKHVKVFDAIDRSARGRTITFAHYIVLDDGEWNLPKVRGSDDAAEAEWIPISKLDRSTIFEDHMELIQHGVSKL